MKIHDFMKTWFHFNYWVYMSNIIERIGSVSLAFTLSVIGIHFFPQRASAQSITYTLRTQFTGSGKCLDVVNDGTNNKLNMADCGNFSGQAWSIQPSGIGTSYRLRTQFTGNEKCLDIVNDGKNNKLVMADCGNFSGQLWNIQPTNVLGFYRLRTQFTGNKKCLDIVNDGTNNQLTMANCGNFSGQSWRLS
jgi:Ricin-type beta-trefoil lectin domain